MDTTKPANSVRSIFTRSKANEGIPVQLKDFPGQWVRVRGSDSDAVQAAIMEFYRNLPEGSKARPADDLGVVASMVAEWSFVDDPTPELLREALSEVPSMKIAVVNASFERANFLPQRSGDSPNGPKSNSDSKPEDTDPSKASAQP